MPNFFVWPRARTNADGFWVYALDAFDARDQIQLTLKIDTHDEQSYGCKEDDRFKVPLNLILQTSGEWMEVATAYQCLNLPKGDSDEPEKPNSQ